MLHVFISIWKTWGRGRERESERTWPHRLAAPFHIHSRCAHQRLSKATKKNIPSQRTWSEQERFGLWYANGLCYLSWHSLWKQAFSRADFVSLFARRPPLCSYLRSKGYEQQSEALLKHLELWSVQPHVCVLQSRQCWAFSWRPGHKENTCDINILRFAS